MSDETPTPDDTEPVADAPGAVATVDAPAEVDTVVHAPVERPTVWSKFVMPLLVPIGVAAAIIFYVLNVSRIFLANDDTLAVVFASVITVGILGGGTALAAS